MDRPGSSNVSPVQTVYTSKALDNWEIVFCYLGDDNVYTNVNIYIYNICILSSQITIFSEWSSIWFTFGTFPHLTSIQRPSDTLIWYDIIIIWGRVYGFKYTWCPARTWTTSSHQQQSAAQHRCSVTPFPNCHRGHRRWGVTKDTTESHSSGKRQLALILRHSVELLFV